MQAHPIYIPTDRMNFQADSQTVLHNINTASTENLNESVDSGRSRESWREPKKTSRKKHYVDGDSGPEEKLAHALTMVEEFIQEKEIYEANKELIRCVALTRIIHGDGHWRLAQSFANLAYGYLTLRAFPVQALQHAESAKEILLNGLDMSKSEEEKREILETLVTIYYTLGAANLMQNNGRESLYNLQKVEKILEELQALEGQKARGLKISNIDLAVSLGRACALQNKLSLAAGYFANAIDIVNMTEGDRVPQLISIYQEMAKVEQLRSRHDRAIEHLLQAHSISKALHNKGSVEAAETALVLAKAYAISGNFQSADVAEMYFAESLNAYQTALGPDDSRTLSTLVEYSKWLVQIGRNQEAYKLLNSTCRSQLKSSGEFSETVAEVLNLMGAICVAEGKMQKAHQLLSRCLEIQTTVYGSQHKKPRQTQELLNMLKSASTGAGNKTR
ncbi:tetratricopeptide repeat protein 23-like isoform X1 [Pleurodeles waltl]|uniref:tetratricopeptide repeat protein 23-like isoform X1 n=2 Tax=Pleurodeles waltl TaxID=8319 RepID=UPI0037097200